MINSRENSVIVTFYLKIKELKTKEEEIQYYGRGNPKPTLSRVSIKVSVNEGLESLL